MGKRFWVVVAAGAMVISTTGCTAIDRYNKAGRLEQENQELKSELSELEQARANLARAFQKELGDYKAKLEMTKRGLVITFLAEVFFDPGKDDVRGEGKGILDKMAKVLKEDVAGSKVAVEGHTDSDPIKHSGWRSNWELSAARALAVLHYFVEEAKITPARLSAVAYGEHQPVAANDTKENKKKNRRVEIVILPHEAKKVKAGE